MERFDPDKKCLKVDGQMYTINSIDFERVVTIRDGGRAIDTCGRPSNIYELKILFDRNSKGLPRTCMERLLIEGIDGGRTFSQEFTLFVVATLLVPISGLYISMFWLPNVIDIDAIQLWNWVSWSLDFLVTSSLTWKKKLQKCCGCLLFLEVMS